MNEAEADNDASDGLVLTPKVALIVVACILTFFFFLDDLIGLAGGGGLFSVRDALRAASEHKSVINVDNAGLRTVFILLCSIAVIIPSAALRANITNRLVAFAILVPIIAGGFVTDAIYDERIVGHFLAVRGYERCENGDFHVGTGKSEVWFDNYVLSQASCLPMPRRS